MSQNKSLENLLEKVSIISKKYDDIAKITGENFNIFSVMNMEWNERYTHSAVIGELLNPNGSHSQGNVFLKLFFEEINELNNINNFDFDNARIIIEEHIGIIDKEYTKGGFIDIVIKDNKNVIVIENKIYAIDQRNQLKRYKNHYPNCVLLYLNLFGDPPSKDSLLDLELNKDYHIITYQNTILNWLEKCHKEAIEQPVLRETIKQYLNLVKKLTNQTINDAMSEEIVRIIQKDLKSAQEISNNFINAKNRIGEEIRINVIEELKCKLDNSKFDVVKGDDKNSQIFIDLLEYKRMGIPFGIESFNGKWGELEIGIIDFEARNKNIFDDYRNIDSEKNHLWIRLKHVTHNENLIDFDSLDFLQFAFNSNQKSIIDSIVNQTLEYIKNNETLLKEIILKVINQQKSN